MFGLFKRRTIATPRPELPGSPAGEADTDIRTIVEDTIPLVAEDVVVEKRVVEGDTVRVDILTETERETVTAELLRDAVNVRRIAIDKPVDHIPATRTEGDATIVPVIRERLVLKKELVLVEEIHITHSRDRVAVEKPVELRRQRADITRVPASETH